MGKEGLKEVWEEGKEALVSCIWGRRDLEMVCGV